MPKSNIVLTFNSLPSVGEVLVFINDLNAYSLTEQFVTLRTSSSLSTIGADIDACILNYFNAINNDYNYGSNGNLYTLSYDTVLNTLTIEAVQDGVTFTESSNTTGGAITSVITNYAATPTLTIDDVTFSSSVSTNYNKIVQVNVDTSLLATSISSPIVVASNADNPFYFDYARGGNITITCTDGVTIASQLVQLPDVLRSSNVYVTVINNPNGATATVGLLVSYGLELQYSLDNVTWQTSNVFPSLANGLYTVYVKDQLSGATTSDFSVSVFTPDISATTPYSYVAKDLSIRYKKNEVWDYKNIYKTEENTLSCEEEVDIPYKYYHKFQTNDNIITQFLSNYETLEANVIREDLTKDALTIVKRSSNIGATDKRDAMYYAIDDSTVGIYYTSGDKYNYYTGIQNDTYELFGELPNYGVKGNFIYLDGIGWFQIQDVFTDEDKESDVLVIDYPYSGIPTEIIVSSQFNRKNYDVYEFAIDMSAYENEEIQVELLMSDNDFGEVNYLSEKIKVTDIWLDTLEFIWYNSRDTYTFYSTGLQNKARLPYELFTAGDDSSLKIHKTDQTSIPISSDSYELMDLDLGRVPTSIKRQLTKAFLHKELYINKTQYISHTAPETEPIGMTNEYTFKAKLQKTGSVFNSEWDGEGNSIEDVEVIGLLQSDNKYIKLG